MTDEVWFHNYIALVLSCMLSIECQIYKQYYMKHVTCIHAMSGNEIEWIKTASQEHKCPR